MNKRVPGQLTASFPRDHLHLKASVGLVVVSIESYVDDSLPTMVIPDLFLHRCLDTRRDVRVEFGDLGVMDLLHHQVLHTQSMRPRKDLGCFAF